MTQQREKGNIPEKKKASDFASNAFLK